MYHCVLKYLNINNVLLCNNICVHVSTETSPHFTATNLYTYGNEKRLVSIAIREN